MRSPVRSLVRALTNRSPVPLAARRGNVFLSAAHRGTVDDERLLQAYGSVGVLFAIVNRTANATAAIDWKLWRKSASGLKEDRIEVTAHAALDLWNKPNPFMPRQAFVETFQQHIDLVGESCWVVGKVGKIPIELWPVRPDRLTPQEDAYEFLKGWVYRGPDGATVPLNNDELIQLKMPNPADPYRGLGPVQSVLTDLDSARYSAEWNRNFFINSAQPGGIIEVEKRLSDDEFDEMSMRWDEQHRGVSKAHRVAIIEQGKWITSAFSQRDMQFAELSTLSDDKIMRAFGFPKAMLGISEDVNRANAEAAEYLFTRWLVKVRLERIKGALNHALLPMFGKNTERTLEFDYENPVPENAEQDSAALTARAGAAVALAGAGWDAAEVLEAVGLPAMSFAKPEPPTALAPAPPSGRPALNDEELPTDLYRNVLDPENAMKWEAVEMPHDDSTCEPCKKNHGKTYKNREDAYKDYPNGKGYIKCVGAQFGNECRGKVVKRKRSDDE